MSTEIFVMDSGNLEYGKIDEKHIFPEIWIDTDEVLEDLNEWIKKHWQQESLELNIYVSLMDGPWVTPKKEDMVKIPVAFKAKKTLEVSDLKTILLTGFKLRNEVWKREHEL